MHSCQPPTPTISFLCEGKVGSTKKDTPLLPKPEKPLGTKMLILHLSSPSLEHLNLTPYHFSRQPIFSTSSPHPSLTLPSSAQPRKPLLLTKAKRTVNGRTPKSQSEIIDIEADDVEEGEGEGGFDSERQFSGREEERDYDKDPEFADILGSCFDDPQKAQARVEERIRKKRNKILQPKTGSATPMKVTFNDFDFSTSYIWFEFYNAPLPSDISLICDTIRSWHIIGRLGGCNSMNMQLSQAPLDKRPSYDPIQGANVSPSTFYNIGDFEVQENLGRIWMDIGTSEPLLLDVLINALTQISSDYIGIKQLVFGGSKFENWKEDMMSEAAGYSVSKI